MKVWYTYENFWRRGDGDDDHTPQDRDDGTGDIIWNTLTKIVIDKDTSTWAVVSFCECAKLLRDDRRWPYGFDSGSEAPSIFIWYLHKALGIKKYANRPANDMTRDPHIAFGACYAHLLRSHNWACDMRLKSEYESVKMPLRIRRRTTTAWRKRMIKDNRKHYVKRLSYFRARAVVDYFEKNYEDDFYTNPSQDSII
jgi:hypothetical protein